MVPTLALMYVEEDVDALFLLDAVLEHTGGAALDELVVDDAVGDARCCTCRASVSSMGRTPFSRNSDIGRAQDGAVTTVKTATRADSELAAPKPS